MRYVGWAYSPTEFAIKKTVGEYASPYSIPTETATLIARTTASATSPPA